MSNKDEAIDIINHNTKLMTEITELRAKYFKIKTALEYYADKFNWRTNSGKIGITLFTDGRDAEIIDGHWTNGRIAREALKEEV